MQPDQSAAPFTVAITGKEQDSGSSTMQDDKFKDLTLLELIEMGS
jgi:hypothetical protein